MRLLDRIAQCSEPFLIESAGTVHALPGPAQFAPAIASCPLRLVLADPLTELCGSLAYADGDGLVGCLDLVHVPATRLWIEWLEAPRRAAVAAARIAPGNPPGSGEARAGVYVTCDARGRQGSLRTFWGSATGDEEPCLSPIVTEFDLDGPSNECDDPLAAFEGAGVRVADPTTPLDAMLACTRFRFDSAWAEYYRDACPSATQRLAVLRTSLGAVATDLPFLLALCLLLATRGGLPSRHADLDALNRRRHARGRAPLLEHVEVSSPLSPQPAPVGTNEGSSRRPSRLHQVRGHLVHRGSTVFWRSGHLRGRVAYGRIATRTVLMHCAAPAGRGPTSSPSLPHPRGHAAPSAGVTP
jgi:hypothetical protein